MTAVDDAEKPARRSVSFSPCATVPLTGTIVPLARAMIIDAFGAAAAVA